ncbi:sulfite exporter TauE/SafE family protein [Tunicatimonas pelagia]|uniref:sulfite exporter TauE/SafE family protein n=1 Tax=Tunicatimonas pelagia TaxID=931531 RepID=UPI0026663F11|nr:sulfite exporter TauE/SafE family protein [Tunicatimonas pelagia]WKN45992.1 sulfite exporter TauE/SafE family protein [Tunicatimonas pelagia]
MLTNTLYFWIALAGLGGGFLAGFLGIGGGVIYILILPIALEYVGIPTTEMAQYVIANSIFGTAAAALFGSITLISNKDFYWKEVALVGLFAIAASYLLLFTFVNTPLYSKQFFNGAVIIFLSLIVLITYLQNRTTLMFNRPVRNERAWYIFTGSVAGAFSALSGLGGGTITVPLLHSGLRMDIKRAKSISLGVIFIASLAITVFNVIDQPAHPVDLGRIGYIIFPVSIPLSLGVLVGSPLGVWVANKISSRTISYIFVGFLILVILRKTIELISAA